MAYVLCQRGDANRCSRPTEGFSRAVDPPADPSNRRYRGSRASFHQKPQGRNEIPPAKYQFQPAREFDTKERIHDKETDIIYRLAVHSVYDRRITHLFIGCVIVSATVCFLYKRPHQYSFGILKIGAIVTILWLLCTRKNLTHKGNILFGRE